MRPGKRKSKYSTNKQRRLNHKVQKLHTRGLGCSWGKNGVIYRLELVKEDELGEQTNYQLHWLNVRKIRGKELSKYLNYFYHTNDSLKERETLELRIAIGYLDTYFQLNKDTLNCNQCFMYPASKIGDEEVRYPIVRRLWNEKFKDVPLPKKLFGIYKNMVWHQQELDGKIFKTITII